MKETAINSQEHAPARNYALDWLRVIAFLLLVPYHVGMFFVTWGFHFKNPETSVTLEYGMLMLNHWRLPLLFLIAGAGVAYACKHRSSSAFMRERRRRLLIPIIVGMLVVVPPQIYFEHLFNGTHTYDSYFAFWRTVFEFVPYPKGSFSWHHLWFMVYVLVYSRLMVPLVRWFSSERGERFLDTFSAAISKNGRIFLVFVPFTLANIVLRPLFPTTHDLLHDWNNHVQSFMIFVIGYIFASRPVLLETLVRHRHASLVLATGGYAVSLVYFVALDNGWQPVDAVRVLMRCWRDFNSQAWLWMLLGYSRRYLTKSNRLLEYATEAVLPFYILHQSVMMVLGYYVLRLSWNIPAKFAVIMLGTYALSWMLYEVIRRVAVLRLLFGLKPIKREIAAEEGITSALNPTPTIAASPDAAPR